MTDLVRLPSLTAVRAFEAAARYENFSRAAQELRVTHGAVSHQVRALELELDVPLFVRNGKRLAITPQGARFAQTVHNALHDIVSAAQHLHTATHQKRLTLSCIPSFAARWLAPRLGRFMELHPDAELVLLANDQTHDLTRDAMDVAIHFSGGNHPGVLVQRLMGDSYYPVCSPQYNGANLPTQPKHLKGAKLLLSSEPWAPWLKSAGLRLPEPVGGVRFQNMSLLIRAAMDGQGIALVRHAVAYQEVEQGSLVRLFDVSVKSESDYYMASPPAALQKPQVVAFRDWLQGEVAAFKASAGAFVD